MWYYINMNSCRKALIITLVVVVAAVSCIATLKPAYAEDKTVETTFFGEVKDDGKGCSVYSILVLVLDILSLGIGIIGVVGITIVGIQYLTSSGNDQQATKARHRMFEIVIGLVAYALLYSATSFLLPGGKFNLSSECSTNSNNKTSSHSVLHPSIIAQDNS